jgi:hypothetical protein
LGDISIYTYIYIYIYVYVFASPQEALNSENLDDHASPITPDSGTEELPIARELEQGVDVDHDLEMPSMYEAFPGDHNLENFPPPEEVAGHYAEQAKPADFQNEAVHDDHELEAKPGEDCELSEASVDDYELEANFGNEEDWPKDYDFEDKPRDVDAKPCDHELAASPGYYSAPANPGERDHDLSDTSPAEPGDEPEPKPADHELEAGDYEPEPGYYSAPANPGDEPGPKPADHELDAGDYEPEPGSYSAPANPGDEPGAKPADHELEAADDTEDSDEPMQMNHWAGSTWNQADPWAFQGGEPGVSTASGSGSSGSGMLAPQGARPSREEERAEWRKECFKGKWHEGVNGGKARYRKRGGQRWKLGEDFTHKL